MMLDSLSEHGNVNHWIANGGGWFFYQDYDKERHAKALLHFIAELPLVIELNTADKKYVICHADYPRSEYEYGAQIETEKVIWNRERISESMDGDLKEIKGADLFIFGHTPARMPLRFANQYYIDTGAVFCGNLTISNCRGFDMAGDWIKMRADLHTHPKVVRMASALKADRLRIVGGLHSAWCLFDVHSVDGLLDGYSADTLDDLIGFPGFSQAMIAVGCSRKMAKA